MANNQYVNKVVFGNITLLDTSGVTVTADTLLEGYTAIDKTGRMITGTASAGAGSVVAINDTLDANGGTIRTITAVSLEGDTVSAAHLERGYTAHNALGEPITGTLNPGSGGSISLQEKTNITPTKSSQTITADSGYDGLSSVQINAIPAAYQDVTGVTAAAGDVVSGKTIVSSTGATVNGTLVIQHYYTGSSAPSSSLGENGDIYLQTT